MDKLELDAYVARLERLVGLLTTALLLAGAAVVLLPLLARIRAEESTTVVAAPLPPPTSPVEWVEKVATPAPDMSMMGMGMGMMGAPGGTMAAFFHELSTLTQLRDEGIVTEEWQAKKAKILEKQLNPGDLRSDLQLVQQLSDTGAICEEERTTLRARLLEIDQPEAGEIQGH